jgi:hypothetical protein
VVGERQDNLRERPTSFGKAGFGQRAVYQGKQTLVADPPSPVTVALSGGGTAKSTRLANTNVTRKEAMFLRALAGSSTKIAAWRVAFPKDRTSYQNQSHKAGRMYRAILSKVGEEELFESMGIGKQATMEKLRQLKDAKMTKVFIVPESGQVVEAGPYEDNTTQFNTTKLLTQIHRMVPDEKGGGGGTVVVNIVSYNPPGTPPWPGGGRV